MQITEPIVNMIMQQCVDFDPMDLQQKITELRKEKTLLKAVRQTKTSKERGTERKPSKTAKKNLTRKTNKNATKLRATLKTVIRD